MRLWPLSEVLEVVLGPMYSSENSEYFMDNSI